MRQSARASPQTRPIWFIVGSVLVALLLFAYYVISWQNAYNFKAALDTCTDPQVEGLYVNNTGGRPINIDPGYISLEHLILATNKKYSHRPYLKNGVYADLTLVYRRKSFRPLEWTYPDYGSAEIFEVLNRLRERYHMQLQEREKNIPPQD